MCVGCDQSVSKAFEVLSVVFLEISVLLAALIERRVSHADEVRNERFCLRIELAEFKYLSDALPKCLLRLQALNRAVQFLCFEAMIGARI
jgi:hypothetical protein